MARLLRILALLLLVPSAAHAEKRIALLIGNKDYKPGVGALANPLNDIRVVGEALRAVGFEVLKPAQNAKRADMLIAIHDFASKLKAVGSDAVGFLYYSGHGIASAGENYLIPVDIEEPSTVQLSVQGVKHSEVLAILRNEAPNAAHYLVLDACRNNLQGSRGGKGFVPVGQQSGVLVAFAAEPGKTASDTGQGSGPYAAALAAELVKPGQSDLIMFHRVRVTVMEKTSGDQVPWTEDGIQRRDRVLFGGEIRPGPVTTQPILSEAERAWRWVKDTTNQPVLENFVKEFGGTPFGAMARARVEELKKQQVAVAAAPVPVTPKPAPPKQDSRTATTFEQPTYRRGNVSIQINTELFGDPLAREKEHTLARCADTCEERRECAGFTFDTRQQICSALKAVRSRTFAEGFISGVRIVSHALGSSQTRKDEKSPPIALIQNIEFFGEVLEKSVESNPDRCARACQDKRECVGYTSSRALAACVMFRKIHSRISGQGFISGEVPSRKN